jgi:hypothetical protein
MIASTTADDASAYIYMTLKMIALLMIRSSSRPPWPTETVGHRADDGNTTAALAPRSGSTSCEADECL